MENETIEITYKNGKGHMGISLRMFLPATQRNLNKLFKIIDESDDVLLIEGLVQKMYDFCEERIADCEMHKAHYKKYYTELEGKKYPAREKMEYMAKKFESVKPWEKVAKEEYKYYQKKANDSKKEYNAIIRAQKSNDAGFRKMTKNIERYHKNMMQIISRYDVKKGDLKA